MENNKKSPQEKIQHLNEDEKAMLNNIASKPADKQTFKSWVDKSKQVENTSYNYETKEMKVKFIKSGYYMYKGVPAEVWEKSLNVDSIGKFLNTDIKPHYGFVKL